MTEKFVVGTVGPPFGLEGFVRVKPFSGDIENLLRLRDAALRKAGKEQAVRIEESVPAASAALIRFVGINTPEAAKTLSGAEILVDRNQASPLANGEFYVEDIKGLAVVSGKDGEVLGRIHGIVEGGAGELAEIKLQNGQTRLVPLRKEFFPEINPENSAVVLENLWILE